MQFWKLVMQMLKKKIESFSGSLIKHELWGDLAIGHPQIFSACKCCNNTSYTEPDQILAIQHYS